MKMGFLAIAQSLLLIVTSGDLLYLYYKGCWYDPIDIIEHSEVAIFWVILITSVAIIPLVYKHLWRQ